MSSKNKIILDLFHVGVLIGSLVLIAFVSVELFGVFPFLKQADFFKIQMAVCIVFLSDFFWGLHVADNRCHYLKKKWLFFIVSIPYLSFLTPHETTNIEPLYYLFRLMPLLRGGYALFIICSWLTTSRATSLFLSYLIILVSMLYLGTLIFYTVEKGVNPQLTQIQDAFWWSLMNATTVGSNIVAVTTTGKILTILIASLGVLMLPIFTVFITDKILAVAKQKYNGTN